LCMEGILFGFGRFVANYPGIHLTSQVSRLTSPTMSDVPSTRGVIRKAWLHAWLRHSDKLIHVRRVLA